MENVREFMNWGPLRHQVRFNYKGKTYKKHRPDPRKKGQIIPRFPSGARDNRLFRSNTGSNVLPILAMLPAVKGLMLMAVKNGPLVWPEPSHGPRPRQSASRRAEIIDWKIKGGTFLVRWKAASLPKHNGEDQGRFKKVRRRKCRAVPCNSKWHQQEPSCFLRSFNQRTGSDRDRIEPGHVG